MSTSMSSSTSGAGDTDPDQENMEGPSTSGEQIVEETTVQSTIPTVYGTRSKGRSALLSKEALMAAEPVRGHKRKAVDRKEPPTQMSSPFIPTESGLRHDKFRFISATMIWPRTSYLEAEAKMVKHFVDSAKEIGGETLLAKKWVINSQKGAFYQCIVRYKDDPHRQASLIQEKDNSLVANYLSKYNTCISTAVIDVRYYMHRYTLPIAVLIGESGSRNRYPHCTCLIFRCYKGKWEVVNKDCTNIDNKDIRPLTKAFLEQLGFQTCYFVPLSLKESERCSINCVGQGLQAVATVLDGNLYDMCCRPAKTTIWKFNLCKNEFENNKLAGIPWVEKHIEKPNVVTVVDSPEIRKRLTGFRTKVRKVGHTLVKEKPVQVVTAPDVEYDVEDILDRQTTATRELRYLVKWLGYDSEFNTWEPPRGLEGCRDLVLDFDSRFEDEIDKGLPGRRKNGNRLKLKDIMPTWFVN